MSSDRAIEIPAELLRRYDVPGPRYTSYPTVPAWSDTIGSADLVRALELASTQAHVPLSLYLHLPFCRRLCTYCGCNVIVTHDAREVDRYIDHLEREIELAAQKLGPRRAVAQMHWGGGTPTFLSEEQLRRVFAAVTARFRLSPAAEIAIEIDPRVTSAEKLTLLRGLGFNRLSMGVQDFAPSVQEAIGRGQTLAETEAALGTARALGFGAVNMDLVYGLPSQTTETWQDTLDALLRLRPDRLALYSFAYVPEARPHQRKLQIAALPGPQMKLDFFRRAYDALVGGGYRAIGMDHFALPEDELTQAQGRGALHRNFQGYTVKATSDVVAFGVTGISDLQGLYAQSARTLPKYYAAIDAGKLPIVRGVWLSEGDTRRRGIITALMCHFEVDLGPGGEAEFAPELAQLAPLEADGLVTVEGSRVTLTRLGRPFVRNVAMAFDAYLEDPAHVRRLSRTV